MNLDALLGGDGWSPYDGYMSSWLSSYDSADLKIRIFSNMVVRAGAQVLAMMPLDYQERSEAEPGGLVRGRWRPQVYFKHESWWQGLGSQGELLWRWSWAGRDFSKPELKARETLLEQLTEHQALEYCLTGNFTVRGGMTGNTYLVTRDAGFDLIDRSTREILTSYCLHPDEWIPGDDVSLALKLALECPDTEGDVLTRANGINTSALTRPRRATKTQRYAADMERELL